MRHAITIGWVALLILLAGCSGTTSDPSGSVPDAPEQAAPTTGTSSDVGEEDLFKQWGPDEMPNREEQPLEFLYWRVDEKFRLGDLNKDGMLSVDEAESGSVNFDRIDVNGDGYLTKKEIIDDSTMKLLSTGESSTR